MVSTRGTTDDAIVGGLCSAPPDAPPHLELGQFRIIGAEPLRIWKAFIKFFGGAVGTRIVKLRPLKWTMTADVRGEGRSCYDQCRVKVRILAGANDDVVVDVKRRAGCSIIAFGFYMKAIRHFDGVVASLSDLASSPIDLQDGPKSAEDWLDDDWLLDDEESGVPWDQGPASSTAHVRDDDHAKLKELLRGNPGVSVQAAVLVSRLAHAPGGREQLHRTGVSDVVCELLKDWDCDLNLRSELAPAWRALYEP